MVPRSLGVDLDRRLVPFNDEGDTGDVPILVRRNGLAWADMLKKPRVVVLGEAGSGKTTEFRQQARRLASEGAPAFLLTVQELALHGVPGGLAPGDVGRFAAWQASEEAGYFFIDSIDEARLTDVKLATALKQLERGIFRGLARARVLFSCRVSDWRPQADREALTWSLLPPGEDQVDVDVVALAPLEFDQVGRLVAFLALTDPRPFDPQAFLDAARAEGVRSFLRRPGDVARMIAHWRSTGKFGTLTVLIESDVVASLREHDLNRKPSLDLKRARQAASALAGLAWLTGKTAFAVPDDALGTERAAACIDVAEVLPDFKVEERQDLLTLPIFDPATYGRVRIHHRSVSEYLAAEWLRELVARGMPRSDLEGLLFAAGPEGPVVPQRWMPIAAWIAGCDADVRRRLIAAEPMSFLYAADPAALMPADKAAILDAIAVGYRDRSRRFTSLDGDMVRRFAVGCPVDRVRAHLETAESDELQAFLLAIAREGRMVECVDRAHAIACNDAPRRPRWEAIELIAAIGTPGEVERLLVVLIDDASSVEHNLGGALVTHCYPTWMSVDRLLTLLARVEPPPPFTGTILPHAIGETVLSQTRQEDRVRLLDGVLALVVVPEKPKQVQSEWLTEAFAGMLACWAPTLADDEILWLEPYLKFFSGLAHYGHLSHEFGGHRLGELLAHDARVRRAVFWWDVASVRSRTPAHRPITSPSDLDHEDRLCQLTSEDEEWLARDALERSNVTDQLLAFNALHLRWCPEAEPERRQELVRRLAAANPALGRRYSRWQRWCPPMGKRASQRRMELIDRRRRRREDADRTELEVRIDAIRAGDEWGALQYLEQRGLFGADESRQSEVAHTYGLEVASAARVGLMRMWRRVPCPLRHEPEGDGWEWLAKRGLTLEIEAGLDFESLDAATAELVARHAAARLNGLPKWIVRLVQARPSTVAQVLERCIEAEYGSADDRLLHGVLSHLDHEPIEIRRLCRPMVFARLASGDPVRVETLDNALEALIAAGGPLDDLSLIVAARFDAAAGDDARRATWWFAWLAADPAGAATALEVALAAAGPTADSLLERFAHRLWRFVERIREFPELTDAAVLGRLVAVAFAHIRPAEDVARRGAYSPGPRHHAEGVRDWWVRSLEELPGLEAWAELRRVAELPQCAARRDLFLATADRRLRNLGSGVDAGMADRAMGLYRRYGLAAIERAGLIGRRLAERSMGARTPRFDVDELLDCLSTLPPPDLERIVNTCGVDPSTIAPIAAPVQQRAVELLQCARHQPGLADRIATALDELARIGP